MFVIDHKHVSERLRNILTLPGGRNDFSNTNSEGDRDGVGEGEGG